MSENTQGGGMGIVVAALVGAAVGAGIALLFAPGSGKETRGRLAAKTGELKDRVASQLQHGKDTVLRAARELGGRDGEEGAEAHDRGSHTASVPTSKRG